MQTFKRQTSLLYGTIRLIDMMQSEGGGFSE